MTRREIERRLEALAGDEGGPSREWAEDYIESLDGAILVFGDEEAGSEGDVRAIECSDGSSLWIPREDTPEWTDDEDLPVTLDGDGADP